MGTSIISFYLSKSNKVRKEPIRKAIKALSASGTNRSLVDNAFSFAFIIEQGKVGQKTYHRD